ncbi:helix-turn-helix transcriptional regulator [Natronosalvus vescus]|uniref:helix-turn-helix transcriptional regulator n=1 Tax=Natronosalvus vescus TaxID=2953881 RepID=UPI0020907A8F|nr:hypothetical protein [Natronosalvus vescus]
MNRSALVGGVLVVALMLLVAGMGSPLLATDVRAADGDRFGSSTPFATETTDEQTTAASYRSGISATSTGNFDSTTFTITVHEDGSATWTFRYERDFVGNDSEEEEEAFEDAFEDFESEETELYTRFIDQAESLVSIGTAETDREMEATNFNRSAAVEQRLNRIGVVEMSFTWTNFAQVEDDEIIVGDVFDGAFNIASDQDLVIESDSGLTFSQMQPDGEFNGASLEGSSSITWQGPFQFLDGQPRVVLERDAASSNEAAGSVMERFTDASSLWLVLGAVLLVGITLTAIAVAARRYDQSGADESDTVDEQSATADAAATPTADPIPDDELLSDEDRVVSLIRDNGGRMKQVNIVDETGWSKSKVSMLLSEMESDGTISKLRVGRENIISLEGFEPEAAKSPYEE